MEEFYDDGKIDVNYLVTDIEDDDEKNSLNLVKLSMKRFFS